MMSSICGAEVSSPAVGVRESNMTQWIGNVFKVINREMTSWWLMSLRAKLSSQRQTNFWISEQSYTTGLLIYPYSFLAENENIV